MKINIAKTVSMVCMFVAVGLLVLPSAVQGNNEPSQSENEEIIASIDRGPVFIATEMALAKGGAIKDDLIKRGLFPFPDPNGKPGVIKFGEIEKLVNESIYYINNDNTLDLNVNDQGLSFQQPGQMRVVTKKYAQIQNTDGYSYRGHEALVTIPTSITLSDDTVHCLYTNHLILSDGKFVESGVGWVNWYESPIIYTYQNYSSTWVYRTISDGTSRSIELMIDITPDPPYGGLAEMYVYDPYDGVDVQTYRAVTSTDHHVDQCHEQASSGAWTETPYVVQYDNYLKNTSNNWIDWNNGISTYFGADSPLEESHGTMSNKYWIRTWCDP
jgi:hypothetical protein